MTLLTSILGIYGIILFIRVTIALLSLQKYLDYAYKIKQWVYFPWYWYMWTPKSYYEWEEKK